MTINKTIQAVLGAAKTGLGGGTLGFTVKSADGATTHQARTTSGISELGTTGTYFATVAFDPTWGDSGRIEWDDSASSPTFRAAGIWELPVTPSVVQQAVACQVMGVNGVLFASPAGSNSNDGRSRSRPKRIDGAVSAAVGGEGIWMMSSATAYLLDYQWNGSSSTLVTSQGNINLTGTGGLGVSVRGDGVDKVLVKSLRPLSVGDALTSSNQVGAIVKPGHGSVISDMTVWPHAGEKLTVALLTSNGSGTATAIVVAHGYQTGQKIKMQNATQTEYNVTAAAITVIDANTFTYPISGTPATPATGSPIQCFLPIYQTAFGMNKDYDNDFRYAEIRRVRSRGRRVSDVVYDNSFTGVSDPHTIVVDQFNFESGWDSFFTFFSWQQIIASNGIARSYGDSAVDPTQSRVITTNSTALAHYSNVTAIVEAGTTYNRAIQSSGGTVVLRDFVALSSGTGAADIYNEGAAYHVAGGKLDKAKITSTGGSVNHHPIFNIADATVTAASIADGAITAGKLAADAITAAKLAADVTTELQNGLATAASLATVDGILDNIFTAFELNSGAYRLTSAAVTNVDAGGGAGQVEIKSAEASIE